MSGTDAGERAGFVQLVRRRYADNRIPRGQEPVFQFDLLSHETIVGVDHHHVYDMRNRETVDHVVWVWIAVLL